MLRRRLISAAIIISVMLVIVGFDHYLGRGDVRDQPGLLLALITSLATLLATGELVRMWRAAGCELSYLSTLGGMTLLCLGACLPILWPKPLGDCPLGAFGGTCFGMFAAIALAATDQMRTFGDGQPHVERLARQVFCFAYLALMIGFMAPHRLLLGIEIGDANRNSAGLLALLAVIVTVKLSDTFAYAFGKLWGRNKMAPVLSPNKTWEGAGGSFVGAFVGALIVFYLVSWFVAGAFLRPLWWVAVYSVVVAAAGIVGDLVESLIKRDANSKDSSLWLPGLGGILDIIDSLIFAGPASFAVWTLL